MGYVRPDSSVGLYEISALTRSAIADCKSIRITTPAAAAALPTSAAGAVQQFTSVERTPVTVVCGGTIGKVGDIYGVLANDTAVSTTGLYLTSSKSQLFQIVVADAAGITAGVDMYIVDASRLVTHDSNGGANKFIGKCKSAPETNPVGLPAGQYAELDFYQDQL